ncbi:FGFR3-like protein, partial [Mya arenaria]
GMEYLEQKKILHCDLAARNILLTTNQQAKVCDFGLSKILMEDKDYYRRQNMERTIPIYWLDEQLSSNVQGMEFLYDNIIIHCDLTARNVLLTSDLTAKVADFGWAKELENDCENSTYRRTDSQAPPEVRSGTYCRQSDIWSFGVVCLEVFLDGGTPRLTKPSQPSPGSDPQEEHWARLAQNERFPKPLTCPDEVYEIMKLCWQ